MTNKYKNVYIKGFSTVAGPYESKGPLSNYFDKKYENDLYFNEKSFEQAEVKLLKDSFEITLEKCKLDSNKIDLYIGGDLQNQIAATDYASVSLNTPFLGIYSACATSMEGVIIGSVFIENGYAKNCLTSVSSHNMVAEKQFRNPTEYGAPKHKTATFTATGGASLILTNEKSDIKVESSTIGKTIDLGIKDVNHMGAVMAPAAADTIHKHLTDLKRDPSYYDLILTGDLGIYGKKILLEYMQTNYNLDISKNYNDCGVMLYDLKKQPVLAGGSGPVCSALVNYGYVMKNMLNKKIKRVLLVPTGALFSPTFVFQKQSIPAIAHAVSLEVVK